MKKIQLVLILTILLLLMACQKATTTLSTKYINTTTTSTLNYTALGVVYYQYSIHSNVDMIIQIPNNIEIIHIFQGVTFTPLERDVNYQIVLQQITLSHELFDIYTSTGSTFFTVYTPEGNYKIEIQLIDDELPYLMNYPITNYVSELYPLLSFDCFGGQIIEIQALNLTPDDYYINGNTIQIDWAYLSSIKNNHQEINFLEFDYVISYQEQQYTGTFTINFNRI